MSAQRPREWWIEFGEDCDPFIMNSSPSFPSEAVHVIEYSAYEAVYKERHYWQELFCNRNPLANDKKRDLLTQCEKALESCRRYLGWDHIDGIPKPPTREECLNITEETLALIRKGRGE